jgi:ketosteroid isomerase-like protein
MKMRLLLTLVTKFDEAFNNGDAAAVGELYTEDAVFVSLTGRFSVERIQSWSVAIPLSNILLNSIMARFD